MVAGRRRGRADARPSPTWPALLEGEGASLADVVKTTVFLRHMRDFAIMNEAYVEGFGDHRPARSAFAVAELPMVALVEIEAWAYAPGRQVGSTSCPAS